MARDDERIACRWRPARYPDPMEGSGGFFPFGGDPEDLDRFGASEVDLAGSEASGPLRAVVGYEVARARRLLHGAAPVLSRMMARLRADAAIRAKVKKTEAEVADEPEEEDVDRAA